MTHKVSESNLSIPEIDYIQDNLSTAVIKKSGSKFCIFSKKGKKLGCYSSKDKAVKRLQQIEFFKKTKGELSINENLSMNDFKDPDLNIEVNDLKILESNEVDSDKLSKAGIKRNKDLLYVRFKLCHEGANKNKDFFTREELEDNYDTALFKPINWEHNKHRIIGCIYDVKFVDPNSDGTSSATSSKPYILCDAAIYKYQFPVQAQIMKERFDSGDLKFSMETWYEAAECSSCGQKFDKSQDYCEHLNNRVSASSTTSRILRGLTFGAAGVVKNPADVDAVGLSVAKQELSDEMIGFIVSDIRTFDDMSAILNGFVSKLNDSEVADSDKIQSKLKDMVSKFISIADTNKSNGGLIVSTNEKTYTEEQVRAKVDAAIEDFRKEQEDAGKLSEAGEALAAKDEEISTLKEELDSVKEEFESYKEQILVKETVASRLKEVEDLNLKLSKEKLSEVKAQLADMSDKTFELFKSSLVEVAKAAEVAAEENDQDEEDETEDNGTEDNEDENSKASLSNKSYNLPNLMNEGSIDTVNKVSKILASYSNVSNDQK